LPDDGRFTARLAAVRPPLGKYAIYGNHELYAEREAGAGSSARLLEAGGFRVLRGEAVQVGPIRLAGLDDPAERRFKTPSAIDEGVLLGPRGERTFTVLLKHRPEVAEATRGRLDLQLSGHTHRGQVFPFGLVVRLMSPRVSGLYALDGSAQLYVSRGTGTWGPPLRLLSRPEVTLFIIEPTPGRNGPAGAGGGDRGTSDNRVFPQGGKPPGPIIHM
jgi:predicted MPP superfamily phosphohydrolase